jgi:transcription-repair coupling factor (superfamily II helicase)
MLKGFDKALGIAEALTISDVADGTEALVLGEAAKALHKAGVDQPALLVYVARDGQRAQAIESALQFYAPAIEILSFPAWDCQPYDRASPNAAIVAKRMMTLSRLARSRGGERPRVVITTINAVLQRVPSFGWVKQQALAVAQGNAVDREEIVSYLTQAGYQRASTVRDVGDFAVRGGILDLYAPTLAEPIRLDFFGDTLESIRSFDPETQRSTTPMRDLFLVPMSEFHLTTDTIKRFRQAYIATFGAATRDDLLYEAISEGRRYPGTEHWLPFFHEKLDLFFSYVPGAKLMFDHQADDAAGERLKQIEDYYESRVATQGAGASGAPYKPLKPDALYLTAKEWAALADGKSAITLSPFALPQSEARRTLSLGAKAGRSFAAERARESSEDGANVFDAVMSYIRSLQADGRKVVIASWTEGGRDRLLGVLSDHGLIKKTLLNSFDALRAITRDDCAFVVLGIENGFLLDDFAFIGEQDILGERLARPRRAGKRAKDFISEAGTLTPGDLVVHVDHGIGRFISLKTITAVGAPHDCLELHYANGDKLFLPVENIELLSRYGSEDTEAALDRLGGAGWQARKSRLKKRIRDMARQLIRIAAARMTREAPRLGVPEGLYQEFAARFPYEETEDQQSAIDSVLDDLNAGRPMDRLICGDVGFGKTEVALRAAFVAAMGGKQVAVVVPTTLLARQHYKTFKERFAGLPLKIGHASRFVASGELKQTKEGLADGTVDIVVGTHALLGKQIAFKELGLVIVDEEQHFGVVHKERLKELRAEVHMLTLSATPIPRTLQLALTGVRELSIIATPPVDRLAVRSFVAPFDGLIVREALLRERYRGGQSFYVCPRIEDIAEVKAFLDREVPEVKVGIGHGQMAATELEDVMSAFYDGKFDVLLSTTIVESGLDIPRANTLIVHRADMFGLAQLYQLRGRVGRSKTRAYALFTLPAKKPPTIQAERRLKVLQSLDTLGAGFQLASHDLDIRGSGNLLGDEQSGHVKEVGYELYQQMLEEAVTALKAGLSLEEEEETWSPTISIGAPVLIPESYIADLDLRLQLYRRLATLELDEDIAAFAAEMADRFGPTPPEVQLLFKVMAFKGFCRRANIDKVDAGPRGIVLSFKDNAYANPTSLVKYVADLGTYAKVRPDMKIVFSGEFAKTKDRLAYTQKVLGDLARIAETKKSK